MDGSSNSEGLGARIVIVSLKGVIIEHALCFKFPVMNNEAKYKALIMGLDVAKELEVQDLRVYSDFQLVVRHIKGNYEAWEENMRDTSKRSRI